MRLAFLTAGAAGMYCGSCMRDNALVTALQKLGADAVLIPTYTPIRTDELDVSAGQVYYGGVNVYLQEHSRLFRYTPRQLDWLLDRKWLLRLAGKFSGSLDYTSLAELTVSMLAGTHGRQAKELARLVDHLKRDLKPEIVLLTNALLSGAVPAIRQSLGVPVVVTLQGDDIFLNALPEKSRRNCLDAIRRNDRHVSGYLATCGAYADEMADYFGIDRAKIRVVYPGVNPKGYGPAERPADRPPTVGYFGRVCSEKGFQHAVSAFLNLKQRPEHAATRFRAAGWLGAADRAFFEAQVARITSAGHADSFEYAGSPDHAGKVAFYQSIDVFTLPTDHREPKGLSVLEAWASGVPAVQFAHGSFPELLHDSGAGLLVPPRDTDALAAALHRLLMNPAEAREMGARGRELVHRRYTAEHMARATLGTLREFAPTQSAVPAGAL